MRLERRNMRKIREMRKRKPDRHRQRSTHKERDRDTDTDTDTDTDRDDRDEMREKMLTGIRIVFEAFGHLLPIFSQNHSVANEILERCASIEG